MIYSLPEIKKTLPIYIFGTSLMSAVLTRQINEAGLSKQLYGYIETNPSKSQFLGLKVQGIKSLTKNQINNSIFLVASYKHKTLFTELLNKNGIHTKQIITIEPNWTSFKNTNKTQSICLFPPINNIQAFKSIHKKITSKLPLFQNTTIAIFTTLDLPETIKHNKRIKVLKLDEKSTMHKILEYSDAIYLWDNNSFQLLKKDYHLLKTYYVNPLSVPRVLRLQRHFTKHINLYDHKKKIRKKLVDTCINNKAKVIFLVYDYRIWKVDPVFEKMMKDSFFEPLVLVCPRETFGEIYMHDLIKKTYAFFKEKKYPVISSYSKSQNAWLTLEELNPNIVIFCSPYRQGQNQRYYNEVFSKYPSIYIPYFFMATNHVNNNFRVYSSVMMQHMWKIYWPQEASLLYSKQFSLNKGENGIVTGYPSVENIYKQCINNETNKTQNSAWKKTKKKKVIFAPHHTIEGLDGFISNLSTFTRLGTIIRKLAILFQDQVHWSFKPHPNLKPKLYLHPDWGVKKTDEYFKFWKSQSYTQLNDGEYDELFIHSDAIIHDCSSFIAEYLFTRKPCLYLINNDLGDLLNDFGKGAMKAYRQAKTEDEIKAFIEDIINESNLADTDRSYFEDYISQYYKEELPSERIVEDIKKSIISLR